MAVKFQIIGRRARNERLARLRAQAGPPSVESVASLLVTEPRSAVRADAGQQWNLTTGVFCPAFGHQRRKTHHGGLFPPAITP
jgi:hypothetical protein